MLRSPIGPLSHFSSPTLVFSISFFCTSYDSAVATTLFKVHNLLKSRLEIPYSLGNSRPVAWSENGGGGGGGGLVHPAIATYRPRY